MNKLLVMRLVDMHKVHPAQNNTHVCSQCKAPVGIYPSGQLALRRDPTLEIVCNVCCGPLPDSAVTEVLPTARSLDEFVSELRNSIEVKKA